MSREVLRFCLGAFALGAAGMYAANRRVTPLRRRERWIKFTVYFVILNTVLLLAGLGPAVFGWFALALVIAGAVELSAALAAGGAGLRPAIDRLKPAPPGLQTADAARWDRRFRLTRAGSVISIWLGYAWSGAGLLLFSFSSPPERITFVYLVVAVFDGFSQVSGQLFGKHRMAEAISPSKTVEGAAGGALAAVATALWFRGLINGGSRGTVGLAMGACGIIVIAAAAGDLAASWVKRRCGVKDFGRLLPQHGGVLDRFDSFLFAAPASLILLHSRL